MAREVIPVLGFFREVKMLVEGVTPEGVLRKGGSSENSQPVF
jgi:hypothetical protein